MSVTEVNSEAKVDGNFLADALPNLLEAAQAFSASIFGSSPPKDFKPSYWQGWQLQDIAENFNRELATPLRNVLGGEDLYIKSYQNYGDPWTRIQNMGEVKSYIRRIENLDLESQPTNERVRNNAVKYLNGMINHQATINNPNLSENDRKSKSDQLLEYVKRIHGQLIKDLEPAMPSWQKPRDFQHQGAGYSG